MTDGPSAGANRSSSWKPGLYEVIRNGVLVVVNRPTARCGPAKDLADPHRGACAGYWLQIANAVTDTPPLPLTTMVAVACQAFVPDGADDWTAARLCPPLVTVAPPPSRILP